MFLLNSCLRLDAAGGACHAPVKPMEAVMKHDPYVVIEVVSPNPVRILDVVEGRTDRRLFCQNPDCMSDYALRDTVDAFRSGNLPGYREGEVRELECPMCGETKLLIRLFHLRTLRRTADRE